MAMLKSVSRHSGENRMVTVATMVARWVTMLMKVRVKAVWTPTPSLLSRLVKAPVWVVFDIGPPAGAEIGRHDLTSYGQLQPYVVNIVHRILDIVNGKCQSKAQQGKAGGLGQHLHKPDVILGYPPCFGVI